MAKNLNEIIEAPKEINLMSSNDINEYWTKERMMNAIPLEIPTSTIEEPETPSSTLSSNKEEIVKKMILPDDIVSTSDCQEIIENVDSTHGKFLTKKVDNIHVYPYRAVGKLFMTFNGQDYQGSAWTIAESAIFTAGHCVHDSQLGGWATNIMFAVGYSNGTYTKAWIVKNKISLNGWVNNRDFKYDLAVCIMDSPVRPTTGTLGWVAHLSPANITYMGIGYPVVPIPGYDFDGKYMWQSTGEYINGTEIIKMHNNMTGGCSGGPWVTKYNNGIYANGINSHRMSNENETMKSPYFGEGFINLYNKVK